jgi:L-ascorbate metabolism protein UlaG (beta-lactamase superfamily)
LVKGGPEVIRGQGDFQIRDIRITGVATFHDAFGGSKRGPNTVFVIAGDGVRVAHMGDLGHVLTDEQVERIGPVDVLLAPVGGYYTIDADDAQRVVDQLGARIVIPMHYRNDKCDFPIAGVDEFARGKPNVARPGGAVLEVSKQSLPLQPEIVVLEPSL